MWLEATHCITHDRDCELCSEIVSHNSQSRSCPTIEGEDKVLAVDLHYLSVRNRDFEGQNQVLVEKGWNDLHFGLEGPAFLHVDKFIIEILEEASV